VTINLESEFVFSESFKISNDFITHLDLVSITCCSLHRINNSVFTVETVFDPGGVTDLPLNATVLEYYGEILRRELRFHNNRKTDLMIIVFDPGGVIESFSVAKFSGTITLTFSMSLIFRLVIVFAIEFAGEFVVIVFDPGGNQINLCFGEF
jgi:hypothetical protein